MTPFRLLRLLLLLPLLSGLLLGQPQAKDPYQRGMALMAKGDPAAAVEEFLAGLRTDADQPRLHYGLGLAYRQLNRLDNALMTFQRALESSRADTALKVEVHREMMRTFLQAGQPRKAVRTGLAALRTLPPDAGILNELTRAYLRLRDNAKARRAAELAVSADPANAEAYHLLGQALQALGRLEDAQTAFETAAAFQPDVVVFRAAAAKVAEARGDLRAAMAHYTAAAALKADPEYQAAIRRLQQATNRRQR